MIRREALFLGLSALFASAASSWALDRALTPDEQQLIADIGTHNSAIRTMVGRFLQIDSQGGRTEGTFYLQRPDKIRFRYNPPSREEIVSVGRGFYVMNRRDKTYYAYPQDTIPLRQFLGDRIDFTQSNIIDVTTSDAYMTITITDDTVAGTVQVSLIFDKNTKDLTQWSLVEPGGSELTFSLYDVQKDVEIPKSYFYIDATYTALDPSSR
ncbi:outer membrane lipoprotein carrier protein LolA [Devosia algicola]|uniref:Outer membrane lipoprotein carrier protein LolA n=1 Tax=Devosia algicola TaxID=3026418 RepID=A0ABY7YKV0_9HYPH|nr:outer membrane lipoprotein carrier protein LolA [Devosia algicola]WDR01783.1 outer membrane lipoprotein carrier protein LolA [Devosia algicola]